MRFRVAFDLSDLDDRLPITPNLSVVRADIGAAYISDVIHRSLRDI